MMTVNLLIGMLGLFMIFPIISTSAYAEDSWTITINPYDNLEEKELFQPRELPIKSGDKITWQNKDSTNHKIVSGVPEYPDYSGEYFASDNMSTGDKYSINLDFTGFAGYYYFCEIHPWFTGKIFFEDNPNVMQSTLNASYEIHKNKTLEVIGGVEPDFANTEYEILIYNHQKDLLFQQGYTFNDDATFNALIDISEEFWEFEDNYNLKLVYGIPSESTNISLKIQSNDKKYKSGPLEVCQSSHSESKFVWDGVDMPNWYKKSLCWFDRGWITETEVRYSLDFFKNTS